MLTGHTLEFKRPNLPTPEGDEPDGILETKEGEGPKADVCEPLEKIGIRPLFNSGHKIGNRFGGSGEREKSCTYGEKYESEYVQGVSGENL